MRALLMIAPVLLLTTAPVAVQERAAGKPPEKGDRVVVRGCLNGPMLQATEMATLGGPDRLASALTFRLSGDKDLLKQMRKDEDGKMVEVTGVLKSKLPRDDMRRGKRLGKTRIVVGVAGRQNMPAQGPPHMPVLEVKSYEPRVAACGG